MPPPPAEPTTQTVAERVQDFVSENKRVILIGTAAAAAAIAVVYFASASRGRGDNSDGEFADRGERRAKDKKKGAKYARKRKSAKDKDKDGPLLRERTPPLVEDAAGTVWLDTWSWELSIFIFICLRRGVKGDARGDCSDV
jgi:import receptor subunit TOM70